jgi:hypothetical protein
MRKLESVGMGEVEHTGKKALTFKKRKWEDLNERAMDILNACGITSAAYKRLKTSQI